MEREYFIRSDKADFEELFQMVKPFEKKIKIYMHITQIYVGVGHRKSGRLFLPFP